MPWRISCCVSIVAVLLTAAPIRSVEQPPADRVTYVSWQPANWDVYLFSRRGQAPERLTDYRGLDYDPIVSPDGRWMVFTSERRGNPDLYAVNLRDRGQPRRLIESDFLEDQAAFSPDGRFLFFVSTYSGNADIYRIPFAPDRMVSMARAENLTGSSPAGDFRPSISPDGRVMAFSSDRDNSIASRGPITRIRSGDVWTLSLTDRTLKRLTHVEGVGWNGSPKWSANGRQIVFYSSRYGSAPGNQQSSIRVMDADGSNQRAVTAEERAALSPEFLLNGRIVYSRRNAAGIEEIVSVNVDGSDSVVESDGAKAGYRGPTKGPAGSFLAYGGGPIGVEPEGGYHRTQAVGGIVDGPVLVDGAPFRRRLPDREIELYPLRYFSAILHPTENLIVHTSPDAPSKPTELWASAIDGSGQRKIATLEQQAFSGLSWSKDGQWIAVTRTGSPAALKSAQSEADIWTMRRNGTELRNITPNTPGFDGFPSFSGDGNEIVFSSGRSGFLNIYVMNADGSNVRRLTNVAADELFPVFSPTANRVAFVSNRGNPQSDIFDLYLLDFDANGQPAKLLRVTHDEGQHGHLQFSYDGQWVVFTSEAGGISDEQPLWPASQAYGEIYAYHVKDGATVRLTHNKWEEGVPSWEAPVRTR